jgi:septal ring-binding cell division protein DamX
MTGNNNRQHEDFEELDDLALSLQKQIKELDDIPDFEDDPDSPNEQNYSAEEIQSQLKQQLLDQESFVSDKTSILSVKWLIPGLIALFSLLVVLTYVLFSDEQPDSSGEGEQFTVELPLPAEKSEKQLNQETFVSVDAGSEAILTEAQNIKPELSNEQLLPPEQNILENSGADIGDAVLLKTEVVNNSELITDESLLLENVAAEEENSQIKKIRLVYVDETKDKSSITAPLEEQLEKDVPLLTAEQETTLATKELIQETTNKPVEINFAHEKNTEKVSEQQQRIQPALESPLVTEILPSPVIGNRQRQWIDIKGKHLTGATSIKLSWPGKNKQVSKLFSAKDTPEQFKFIDNKHLRLHINTGIEDSIWQMQLFNQELTSVAYQFKVVKPFQAAAGQKAANTAKIPESKIAEPVSSKTVVNENKQQQKNSAKNFIDQQNPDRYTLQLLGSPNLSAIQKMIAQNKRDKNYHWFMTSKFGKPWYSLIYGSYKSKNAASRGFKNLPAEFRRTKPWIRQFSALQSQISTNKQSIVSQQNKIVVNHSVTKKTEIASNLKQMTQSIKNIRFDQWTLQLISLGSEKEMQSYIDRNKLNNKAKYFSRSINGATRYTLIYGRYSTKQQAQNAQSELPEIIRKGKPWVRQYGEIHRLMN